MTQQAQRTAPAPIATQSTTQVQKSPANMLNDLFNNKAVRKQFEDALGAGAPTFIAAVLELFNSDGKLQKCDPKAIFDEALKAAVLHLPINKSLGQAFIIAYNNTVTDENGIKRKKYEPTFQIGYKGLYQLAMRTGQYRIINADVVYEGELKTKSKLTGEIDLDGEKKSETVIGYFAYIELLNGFHKALYMSVEEMAIHAKRYSKAIANNREVTVESLMELAKLPVVADSGSVGWLGNFHGMAIKTALRNLLSKYGYLSVELQKALASDDTSGEIKPTLSVNQSTQLLGATQAPKTIDVTTVDYEDVSNTSETEEDLPTAPDPGF